MSRTLAAGKALPRPARFALGGGSPIALALGMLTIAGCSGGASKIEAASSGGGGNSSPLILSFVESPSYDVGFIGFGGSKFFRISIQTTGTGNATIDSYSHSDSSFAFNGGSFPGTGGTCAQPLAGTCSLGILFTPASVGVFTDTVTVNYTSGGTARSISMTLNGQATVAAALSISDSVTYDYGTKVLGTTTEKTFTVTNAGGIDATAMAGSGLAAPYTFKGGSYPGTGGTCGLTLNSLATCTMVVEYAPTVAGASSDQIVLAYHDGTATTNTTRDIQGTGQGLASLTISDGATYNYGNVVVGSPPAEKIFTVTNGAGLATATAMAGAGLAAPFDYKDGAYPGTGGTCSTTLAGGASCTLIVTYRPLAAAAHSDTIELAYDNGSTTVTALRGVQGTGVVPSTLEISDSPTHDYGTKTIGTATDKTFTVTFTGVVAVTAVAEVGLAAPFAFKGGTYPGTGGNCGTTISSNCTIVVTFTPTVAGFRSDTIELNYNDSTGVVSALRPVQGTGQTAAVLTISDAATYNFGSLTVGETADHLFTVTKTGTDSATAVSPTALAAPYSFKGGAYPGTGGSCGATIAADCTIMVTYTPTAPGTHNRNLVLGYHNGAIVTSSTRAMTGTATAAAVLTISDGVTYNYGNVASGAPAVEKTFTISNAAGAVTATSVAGSGLAAPFEFKDGTYPGTGGTCGATLAGGASCTIIVTYAPTTVATHNDTIVIDYDNGPILTSSTRAIQGTGITPASLTISDGATYSFGTRTIASVTEKTFTVTYAGSTAATGVTGTGLAAPFAYKGGSYPGTGGTCSGTISADCTIVVTFTPSAGGLATDTIQLDYSSGAAATSAFRAVEGTGQAAASLVISDAATYDFGSHTNGDAVDHTFTVTYSGGDSASAVNPVVLTPPYSYKGGNYPGTGGTCGSTIAASCSIVVTFNPTTAGTHNQTLTLDYNDGVAAQSASRAMTGIGKSPALLTISDNPQYDFGSRAVTTSTDRTFTVTNTGQTDATSIVAQLLSAPFSFKGGTYPGTGGDCSTDLSASASCSLVVTFNPTVAGGYSETIDLGYDDGVTNQSSTRSIIGTGGVVANLTISDGPTYDFGTVAKSYSANKTLTVTNAGGSQATTLSETTLAGAFDFLGGTYPGTGGTCTTTLDAAATCTLVVEFTASAATAYAGDVTLSYFNGTGTTTSARALSGTGATLTQIAAGDQHTCALYSTGQVKCWGSDTSGQLGDSAAYASSTVPVFVSGITNATAISAGTAHTCAVLSNGRIYCWGSDSDGQLGNGGGGSSGVPVQVSTYTDFDRVAAGGNTTCGRRTNEATYCWGDDSGGQLGNGGSNTDATTPSGVGAYGSGSNVEQLTVGALHACAMLNTGELNCWGTNSSGQVGDNSFNERDTPVSVNGYSASGGSEISAGGSHTCIRTTANSTRCFGSDTYGQLGNDSTLADRDTPGTVALAASASSLALGTSHSCAIIAGAVKCWGRDDEGQLGDNSPSADEPEPVDVATISGVTDIAAGDKHSCAVQSDGAVYCWGQDSAGQLGNGAGATSQGTPDLVTGL